MNHIEQIKQESIKEFSSEFTQNRYRKIAEQGFWNSEEILIDKYFKTGSRILDIGCGSGRTAFSLHKNGFEVVGVDITPAMVDSAKKITSLKNVDIDFKVGDATCLEFSNDFFDGAIFANSGWAQIPGKKNRQKALNEIYRVIRPGGYFILNAHQRYYFGSYLFFWIKQWIKFYILKPLGFKIKEIDFGDLFFKRNYANAKQFIHLTSRKETERQIKNAGFKIEMRKNMGEISKEDVFLMQGSLSKNFDSYKSPIFYVCKKQAE